MKPELGDRAFRQFYVASFGASIDDLGGGLVGGGGGGALETLKTRKPLKP